MEGMRIPFEGLQNTRDLGGYRSSDGRRIAPGRLLRGEALLAMTERDKARLLGEYRLQMVIDLRTAMEAEQRPDPELPGVRMIFNPILDEATAGFTRENRDRDPFLSFMEHAKELNGKPESYTQKLYRDLVLNRQAAERYRNFLSILADAEPQKGAILWHCSAGKDRAGMATAFLLLSLGVPVGTVLEDFLKTNEYLKEETRRKVQKIRELGGSEETAASAAILSQVKREDMEAAFRAVRENYGSLDTYLEEQLGLTKDVKRRLEEKYLVVTVHR